MALTSIFGLCFMSVCLIKPNWYSLIYSSLQPFQFKIYKYPSNAWFRSRKNCVIFDDNFGLPFKYWSELLGMRLELYKQTEWVIFDMSTSSKCALCCKSIYSWWCKSMHMFVIYLRMKFGMYVCTCVFQLCEGT